MLVAKFDIARFLKQSGKWVPRREVGGWKVVVGSGVVATLKF